MSQEFKHYRLPVDSETGRRLTDLYEQGKQAVQAASDLVQRLRADEFEQHPAFAQGGIGAFYFRRKPGVRRWDIREKVDGMYQCFPNTTTTAGRKVLKEVSNLPVVKMEQVAEAFGLDTRRDIPSGTLLPMFFRVEQQWDYVKTSLALTLPELETVTEEEFERALKYVKEEEGV